MSFDPFFPVWLLVPVSLLVLVARVFSLWQMFRHAKGVSGLRLLGRFARWGAITFSFSMVLVAAFGLESSSSSYTITTIDSKRATENDYETNVFLVVDRSLYSLARDQLPGDPPRTRLNTIRDDAAALLEKFSGAKFGVIGWGRSADVEWPLSSDRYTLGADLQGLTAYAPASGGYSREDYSQVDTGAAAAQLKRMLEYQRENYPERANVVVYFGCGESSQQAALSSSSLQSVAGLVDAGVVLGYGSKTGGVVLLNQEHSAEHPAMKDPDNSKNDLSLFYREETMQRIGSEMNLPYLHRERNESIDDVVKAIKGSGKAERPGEVMTFPGVPLYQLPLILALPIALAECYRFIRARRRIHWSTRAVRGASA
ncbi:MAG: vWA domain-containing protein [Segniliparus sp.]|uniref:vWA domain-containing protein n=1 Tax=Segniliparus sp. TaxID=2804064 RepID=UPI003F323704